MGETRTDQYLKTLVELKDLDKIVEKILDTKK